MNEQETMPVPSIRTCRRKKRLAKAVVFCVLLLAAPILHARPVAYKDGNGAWGVMEEEDWPRIPKGDLQIEGAVIRPAAAKITFNITFVDVTGKSKKGFDDPGKGTARRAAVRKAAEYVDSVLNHPGGVCDIEIQASSTDGTGPLATGSPFFYPVNGYVPGFPYEHIIKRSDPSASVPDLILTVDFGYDWYEGVGNTPAGKRDLYSVILHEITHGLGLLSMTGQDGQSALAPNRTLSFFDYLLYTGNGAKLWDLGCNFNGTVAGSPPVAPWLAGSDGGVRFHGAAATTAFQGYPPVYAPNPFDPGSSIGHWIPTISGNPVLLPALAPGEMRRTYADFEIGALQDLGYTLEVLPPDIRVTPALLDFGSWPWDGGPTAPLPVRIENTGAGPLEFAGVGIEIVGGSSGDFQIVPSVSKDPILAGADRTVSIRFDPSDNTVKTAVLRITTNDPDAATVDVPLKGTGTGRMPTAAGGHWRYFK